MYDYYKEAREMAWKVLIHCGISSLPVNLSIIADYYNIEITRYSECNLTPPLTPEVLSGDGFITKVNDKKIIFLNDKIKTRGRRRFTVGHELGHGIMGHPLDNIVARNSERDSKNAPLEMQANVFSRDILAPSCVLNALGVTTVKEIMAFCDISKLSAEIRLERLQLLRRRGAFGFSPLERQVYKQFEKFIKENRLK